MSPLKKMSEYYQGYFRQFRTIRGSKTPVLAVNEGVIAYGLTSEQYPLCSYIDN